MQDLTARVTSRLLQFPEVTLQALGEHEGTLDSVLCGKLSRGRNGLAWLACGPQLEVVNSVTGERLSAYRFSGVNEQPPIVRVVKEFSWQKRTGLLVGLEEAEGSVLCLYDLGVSRVVKAVVLPGRVTAIEPIANHGGASVRTQHLHQSLRWLFGVAAVATDVGHLLLVDLCLDDLSYNWSGIEEWDLEVVTRNPAEVPLRRETVTREGRHLCFELQNPSGTAVSTLCYISRSNQLVVGFSDGYLSLWNMKTLRREHHCQLEGGGIPVYAVTFQEPENDPRNCCYLWAVQSTQESEGDVVSLHLLQLTFGDRKRLASGQVMYEGLEYCDERYSVDLTGGVLPLRGQIRNIKLISCQTIEKFPTHVDSEDSIDEVISPETSVSIFGWQVNTYGQATPSTYLGVFDINRWYHAQMPDSLRPEEFLHDCPYFALWSLDTVISMTSPKLLLDILVRERSLSQGVPASYPPPEQFFNPSNYNFDGTCLLNSGVVHMTCTGFQKEALNFLKKSGPLIREAINGICSRCLVAGLQSPGLVDVQPSSLSQNDCDPRLRERAVARNSILDQYGKILPRVQRKLAAEKAKPYHLPSSLLREDSRPKPLSTVVNQANAGNVHPRENFLSTVLSNIREFWPEYEQKTGFSQGHGSRPRAAEPPATTHPLPGEELRNAFVGTPVTKSSPKCSSLPNLVYYPIPSCSTAQSPHRAFTSFRASSPLRSNMPGSISQKNFSGTSELNFLQTPPVAKRAKVLATSASGVPGFTPQSILRSSLRTTPLATPSASPGRSVTPPLRAKEPGISSREENSKATWTAGVTEGDTALSGPSSEDHRDHGGVVEDAWSESRSKTTLFTLSNPEDDHAELEESSESTPGDGLEKMEVSKENSNISARSDQTTLEYHDAKSLSDFEDDVIFIAAQPAHSAADATASFQESEREGGSEMVEDKPFQAEQPDSSELRKKPGFVEESNAECLALPEDGKLVFKATEAAPFGTASEGGTNHQESKLSSSSEEKAIPVAPNPQLSASPERDSESVIRIPDSEDIVSTHSENRLKGKSVDLPEECKHEAAEVEENVPFRQEEIAVSNNLAKTEEMNVIEDSAGKAQTSEEAPETSPYSELHPLGNLQYRYGAIEQQFACDLPDDKDDECDAAEADGELFISQSNFTLVLEGEEGEGEMGGPTSGDASKPTGTTPEGKPVNSVGNNPENQEQFTNSVSTVTNDQESQNIAESLPYVPEPIKVAIAENLLDVIKDTRSKEFTSEVVEQSIHETIGKKGARFQKAKAALTTVPEEVEDETSIHQEEYVSTRRTRTRGQLSRSPSIPSAGAQQLLKADKPFLLGLSPRRSTRRTKEASETPGVVTEGSAPDEQIPVMPVTPRRGRKPKPTKLEKVDGSHSDGQTLPVGTQSIAVTPRRGLRRAKEAASEVSEEATEEMSLAEGSIAASKRTRGGKSSAGDEGTGQTDADDKIKMAVSPSRSARKQKSVHLKFTETIVKDQEVQPSDLLAVPTKRGRRRKMSTSEVPENSDLDLSKLSLPPTECKLPVTPRRSARKGAQNLLADPEPLSTQEGTHSGGKVEILDTPRRSARRVPRGKPEGADTCEQTPAQPNEELSTPRATVRTGRRGRKRRSVLEEGTGEEKAFPQGPAGSPLLLEDINPSGRDETPRTVPDRITRTRSRKTAARQKLPVEENESFLFSPPLTKLTKKCKAGEADHPVQLKDVDPDLSSQFVFSPPLLRSRRINVSSISGIAKEPVIEDSAGKAQTSEEAPETSPYSELHPLGNLQYRYGAIEQQFACDLPDDKDDECDAAEADGELFISQSNFTLVLEGEEGEGEMGGPTSGDASKPTGTTPEGKPVNSVGNNPENQEQFTNSVSTVTNDQESQNIAESLPYVPEPIKVAIAENLLDVIKDTRSKEFTSEVVEQSIHETIGKKGARFQKAKAALTTVPEEVEDETSIHQEEYVSTRRTRTRGQLSRSPSIPSAGAQQLLKADKPFLLGLSPRRSTRRTKEASETPGVVTEGSAPDEQIPVMPVTPRRGRKPRPTKLEKVDGSHSDGQTLPVGTQSIAVTPRRGLRRAKEAASEVSEEATEEMSLAEGSIAASKRTRGGKSSAGDEGTGQTDADDKIKMAVSPSRSARKQKSVHLKFTETIVKNQEVQPSDLLAVPTKRGRRRKMSTSEVPENSDLDLSKLSLPPTECKLPVTPRRSARKGAQNLLADPEPLSTQEGTHSGGKVEILDTPRRSARRVPRGKPEGADTCEQTPAQPNEELSTPRATVRTGRRGRKRRSVLEEGTGEEEAFPQGPAGSPLLLEDINPSGRDETPRTVPDRITRTRSRKTAARQKLPVEENESFLFSPPLTKLTKKCKAGEADHPVQLKDVDPDLSSQFVFSPPLLRSRRINVSSISGIAKEPELLTKEEEDAKSVESVGKQKLKRGRTAKSEVKKSKPQENMTLGHLHQWK